jgi:hypothetical protein
MNDPHFSYKQKFLKETLTLTSSFSKKKEAGKAGV